MFSPKFFLKSLVATAALMLAPQIAAASPSGTWLSQPQIRFHVSNHTLPEVMAKIKQQQYTVVFLDFRNVPDDVQQKVTQAARQQQLQPIVWIQSPQLRSLTVPQLLHEARHGDGLQVDDHFFSHYSQAEFSQLRAAYTKRIYCSIQPFQAKQVPASGCNQLDVQCYTASSLSNCMQLADRLKAVTSLSAQDTYHHRQRLGDRKFNVFLWPYSNDFFKTVSQK
ncbi:MAG: hypothetical protein HC790_08825 [Acaryochloridaceae cyanobacterium CSU_3_4]|nr:hypothetical protein [Acaryochloris sp. SU_5_25]NJN38799.1 hypothetical protein [Acaryochloridaceae cyanobacterium CSU_3_4]